MTKTIIRTIGTIVIVEVNTFALKFKVSKANTKMISKQKIIAILSNSDNLYFL